MTNTTPHRATPEQWAVTERWAAERLPYYSCILELRDRLAAAEQRISELEAGATCPHIVTTNEGTSYCALAEQQARIGKPDVSVDTSAESAPIGSLLAAVHSCIVGEPECGHMQARAALREVVMWLNQHGEHEAAGKIFGEVER